ncbi:MAG TPA: GatB/YqeY domain-containing protein [Candidatus Saccharimonadales bacterium]|nr:GatB/YqeY domain-containing protein [Candidatus Saccharimonadales bacterium]
MLQARIESDLKQALLSQDKQRSSVLSMLKSTLQYAALDKKEPLTDEEVQAVLAKEAKKRQESADLYEKGNAPDRRDIELAEKKIIEEYLPEQMSDEELQAVVDKIVASQGKLTPQAMGKIIQQVRAETEGKADGGRIAQMVKAKLTQ